MTILRMRRNKVKMLITELRVEENFHDAGGLSENTDGRIKKRAEFDNMESQRGSK